MNRIGIIAIFMLIACLISFTVYFFHKKYRLKNANVIQVPLMYFILGLILLEALIYLPVVDYISDQYLNYRGWSIIIVFLMIFGYIAGLVLINWFFACKVTINDTQLAIRTFFYKTYLVPFTEIKNTTYRLECICLQTEKKCFHIYEGCDGLRILLTVLKNKGVPVEQLPSNLLNDNACSIVIK